MYLVGSCDLMVSPRVDGIKWCLLSSLLCASSKGASRRYNMLGACRPFDDNGLVKICLKWLTHNGVWGSNLLVFIEPTESRKMFQLEVGMVVISNLKLIMCKTKV